MAILQSVLQLGNKVLSYTASAPCNTIQCTPLRITIQHLTMQHGNCSIIIPYNTLTTVFSLLSTIKDHTVTIYGKSRDRVYLCLF